MIALYPNPNNGFFSIAQSEKINNLKVEVTNVLGEIVLETEIHEFKTEINLTKHAAGIYFVKMSADKDAISKKIIIQ